MAPDALGAEQDDSGAEHGHPHTTNEDESVPDSVREAARRAFDARPRDVLIADLVYDSLLDGERRASVDPSRRSLRFGTPEGGADVTVIERPDGLRVIVLVLPAQRCDVEIRTPDSATTVTTDDAGQVQFDAAPGLMSLVIRPTRSPHTRPLQTAWVRV